MKIIIFIIFLIVMIGDIYMNYKVGKKIEENIVELKERKILCTEIKCNIESAIEKNENAENITIEELTEKVTEKVAEKLKDEFQKVL